MGPTLRFWLGDSYTCLHTVKGSIISFCSVRIRRYHHQIRFCFAAGAWLTNKVGRKRKSMQSEGVNLNSSAHILAAETYGAI